MHFDLDTIDTVQVDRIKSNFNYQGYLHENRFHIKWNFQTHKIHYVLQRNAYHIANLQLKKSEFSE